MTASQADIMARLQREILPLQGYKPVKTESAIDLGLGPIRHAFPGGVFPTGAIHEFCSAGPESAAANLGFVSVILGSLMRTGGVVLWISASRNIFPPALKMFDIEPDKIVFIDLKNEKDIQWSMEEALKCEGLAAVIGEMQEISFTASRRLQLAVEQSRVTGFLFRRNPRHLATTASIARWQVSQVASEHEDDMPGIGHPRWKVDLLKIRNGKPGSWLVEWASGRLRQISKLAVVPSVQKKKTG